MKERRSSEARLGLALLLVSLVIGAALRFSWIRNDLPMELELSNAPQLDAFWYVEPAQARADGSGFDFQPPYNLPLWIGAARVWFALFGTGVTSSQALAAFVGTLEIALVFLAFRKLGPRVAGLAAFFLATSYWLGGSARTPLVYTPLGTALAAIVAIWANGGPRGRALAWLLLLALFGSTKGVVIVLAPGLALGEWALADRSGRVRLVGVAFAGAAVFALLSAIDPRWFPVGEKVIYAGKAFALYFAPDMQGGFHAATFNAALRHLVCAVWDGEIVRVAPGLVGFACVGGLVFLRAPRADRESRALVAVASGWILALLAALAFLEYKAMRFYTIAGPAIAALAAFGASRMLELPEKSVAIQRRRSSFGPRAWGEIALATLTFATFFLAIGYGIKKKLYVPRVEPEGPENIAAALGLGAAVFVALGARGFLGSLEPIRPEPWVRRALAALIISLMVPFDVWLACKRFPENGDTIARNNELVRSVFEGSHAVLAGPYAATLCAGSRIERRVGSGDLRGGAFAALGIAAVASEGYTHLALEAEQDAKARLSSRFAELGHAPSLLVALDLRRSAVLLFRFKEAVERGYKLTPLEVACDLQDRGEKSAALDAFASLRNRALCVARARALLGSMRADDAALVLSLVPRNDPERAALERTWELTVVHPSQGLPEGVDAALLQMLQLRR